MQDRREQQSERPQEEDRPPQPEPQRPANSNRETTPPTAPSPDAWGTPQDSAPDWGGPSGSSDDDPWADIPEFDPDSDMEDSDGPEGWSPEDAGPEAEQVLGASGGVDDGDTAEAADDPDEQRAQDDGWSPHSSGQGDSAPDHRDHTGPQGPAQDTPGTSAPQQDAAPAAGTSPAEDTPMPVYDPGPLVPEVEHSIPVFARPESELRAEFAARFGNTRPQGFSRTSAEDSRPDTPAADPEGPSSSDPSADDTPDPGVPAPDHDDAPSDAHGSSGADDSARPGPDTAGSPPGERSTGAPSAREAAFAAAAAGNDPKALAERGGGHPASWFGPLMQRMAEGGSAEPPVNEGSSGPGGPNGGGGTGGDGGPGGAPGSWPDSPGAPTGADRSPGGRPSAADLSRPRGEEAGGGEGPSSGSAKPGLDPRAAAVQAAREAARGRGPRPEPTPQAAERPSVSWEDEVASDDDISLEESGLVGRAVVERILGARLIEELPGS